jgi:alpha-L-rhamnosidase
VANGPALTPKLARRPLDSLQAATPAHTDVLPVDGAKDTYHDNNTLPLLRKTFVAKKRLAKSTLFISGLRQFKALLNGQRVGNHFLDPGWTKYDKQAQYVTFDVT